MEKPKRRYDIDWLRVLLIFSVFLYHSAHFFVPWDWHVKDEAVSRGFTIFMEFFMMWMLLTIFIVSGASIRFSLGIQKPGRFVRGKVTRLFVPLVFGIFILSPRLNTAILYSRYSPHYSYQRNTVENVVHYDTWPCVFRPLGDIGYGKARG